jgi:hypothetical protein
LRRFFQGHAATVCRPPHSTIFEESMKKILAIALVVAVLVPALAFSQNAYTTKDMNVSAGIGIGTFGYFGSSTLPPIFVGFDMAVPSIHPKVSLGGVVAYSGSSEDLYWAKYSYKYIVIAARGSYHFLENNKNIDAYAGAGLGFNIVSSSAEAKAGYKDLTGFAYSVGSSWLFFDAHAGARYYFSPKFGVEAELGYGISILHLGITYKLN